MAGNASVAGSTGRRSARTRNFRRCARRAAKPCGRYSAIAKPMLARTLPFAVAAAVFLLDRITKLMVQANVSSWDTLRVIPGLLNIVHAENRGVAFGLFAESTSPWRSVVLIGLSTAVMIFIVSLLWKPGHEGLLLRIGLALVLGGAIGNLYDR